MSFTVSKRLIFVLTTVLTICIATIVWTYYNSASRNGMAPMQSSVQRYGEKLPNVRDFSYSKNVSCPELSQLKLAFVTALVHDYEHSCKEPVSQSVSVDFLAYTDKHFHEAYGVKTPNTTYNKWKRLDAEPYRYGVLLRDQNSAYHNSLRNNQHPFNRAKVFKLNLHRLPELQKYHILIWLDATLQITNPKTAELMIDYLCRQDRNFVGFEQPYRMNLKDELVASLGSGKYKTKTLHDLPQPVQDVESQYVTLVALFMSLIICCNTLRRYQHFLSEGFHDKHFGPDPRNPKRYHSVHNTAFLALNMLREETHDFMEKWWLQNLLYTTQDQLSFPYVAWALNVQPYGLPDDIINGTFLQNDLYVKLPHHTRK